MQQPWSRSAPATTYGKGVARNEAFPAQLEAILRAKGLNVNVINAGINGDTTEGMLQASGQRRAERHQRRNPCSRAAIDARKWQPLIVPQRFRAG